MEQVAILGVGMKRFGFYPDAHVNELGRDAGLAALDNAGLTFADIDAVYAGHIFIQPMTAVRAVKELGCTGVPIQRIENASATGSAALREAYLAVAAGYYDKVLPASGSAARRGCDVSSSSCAAWLFRLRFGSARFCPDE